MFVFKHRVNDNVCLEARTPAIEDEYMKPEYAEKGLDGLGTIGFEILRVTNHSEYVVGRTYLTQMPGCCGIVISHQTTLKEENRHSGLSDPFRELKNELAKHFGYTLMMATTRVDNIPACSNLFKSKYKVLKTFLNKRTNNYLWLGIKEIH